MNVLRTLVYSKKKRKKKKEKKRKGKKKKKKILKPNVGYLRGSKPNGANI